MLKNIKLKPLAYRLLVYAFLLQMIAGIGTGTLSWVTIHQMADFPGHNAISASDLLSVLTIFSSVLSRCCFGFLVYMHSQQRKWGRALWVLIALLFQIEGVILYFVYSIAEMLYEERQGRSSVEPS